VGQVLDVLQVAGVVAPLVDGDAVQHVLVRLQLGDEVVQRLADEGVVRLHPRGVLVEQDEDVRDEGQAVGDHVLLVPGHAAALGLGVVGAEGGVGGIGGGDDEVVLGRIEEVGQEVVHGALALAQVSAGALDVRGAVLVGIAEAHGLVPDRLVPGDDLGRC
jgi:hypothetical protein